MSYYPFVTITLEQTGRPYTYRNHIEDLSVGDCVVVELPNGYALGRVKDLLVDDLRGDRRQLDRRQGHVRHYQIRRAHCA